MCRKTTGQRVPARYSGYSVAHEGCCCCTDPDPDPSNLTRKSHRNFLLQHINSPDPYRPDANRPNPPRPYSTRPVLDLTLQVTCLREFTCFSRCFVADSSCLFCGFQGFHFLPVASSPLQQRQQWQQQQQQPFQPPHCVGFHFICRFQTWVGPGSLNGDGGGGRG